MNRNLVSFSIFSFSLFLLWASTNTAVPKLPELPDITSQATNLTRETSDPTDESYPRVSPDGKFLLYTATQKAISSFSNSSNVILRKENSIVKKEIGSATRNPLVQGAGWGSWTPDGQGIVFSYLMPEKPVLVHTNLNGVGLNYISQGAMGDLDIHPTITNDGKLIIFSTRIGGATMLCRMDTKGGNFTVLTDGYNACIQPNNNDKILYVTLVSGKKHLFLFDVKTGQKTQITSGENNNESPVFSTDSKWISFESDRENPKSSVKHLYVMKIDGTDLKQITSGPTSEVHSSWSSDGWLYFSSNAGGNLNIWKVKPILYPEDIKNTATTQTTETKSEPKITEIIQPPIAKEKIDTEIKVGDKVFWQDDTKKNLEGRVFEINSGIASINLISNGKSITKKVTIEKLTKKQ
jgi:TolB protein